MAATTGSPRLLNALRYHRFYRPMHGHRSEHVALSREPAARDVHFRRG